MRAGLLVFFAIVTGGLLAFGSVDRAIQIGLIVLFGVGLVIQPPRLMNLPAWMNRVMVALLLVLILKELMPASWFGIPAWRSSIVQDFGVRLPVTHHPEPGRAVDAWLIGALAILWFSWVRALSVERDDRVKLAWILLVAGAIVSVASFGFSKISEDSIFGLRYTPEWFGFGPFPNRNHTGSLFAMAIIMGLACVVHAGSQKRIDLACTGIFLIGVVAAGLFRTQSRGALLALGFGLVIFAIGMIAKARTRKSIAIAVGVGCLTGAVVLIAGEKTVARMVSTSSAGVPDDSARARIAIWRDTWTMVKDSPVFGTGAGSFQSIFPFYQNLDAEDVTVRHPESGILQWLAEFGALPVLIMGIVAIAFVLPHARYAFERRSSFFVAVGGFATMGALLIHSLVDVPSHRWGTAGFALAALAIACPASHDARTGSRRAALIPMGIAAFWLLPIFANRPAWSPFQLDRVLSAGAMQPQAYGKEIQTAVRWFPLSPKLRLLHGQYLEITGAKTSAWMNEYRIAARLVPASGKICAQIARRCEQVAPSVALHYWQMSIERASLHREEAFRTAVKETVQLPSAQAVWEGYVETHPELLLIYAESRPKDDKKQVFARWWELRGSKEEAVSPGEAEAFLRLIDLATVYQVITWARLPNRPPFGTRKLIEFLKKKGAFEEAWEVGSRQYKEPEYPAEPPKDRLEDLKHQYERSASDVVNARNYAHALELQNEKEDAELVILDVAKAEDAPRWFVEKAAHLYARKGEYAEAVELISRIAKE